MPKINKYGFVHIGKKVYEELGLANLYRKEDIPVKADVDAKGDRIILTLVQPKKSAAKVKAKNKR